MINIYKYVMVYLFYNNYVFYILEITGQHKAQHTTGCCNVEIESSEHALNHGKESRSLSIRDVILENS